jgi:hypothetical protein
MKIFGWVLLILLGLPLHAHSQVVTDMTPVLIQEAIDSGAPGPYKLQECSGWGNGPLLGYFTTPYSRIVLAAAAARKRYKTFTSADVTADMLAPELHVYAISHAIDGMKEIANVEAVVVMPYKSKDRSAVVLPTSTTALTEEYRNLMGAVANGRSIMAVFPLSVLDENNELRVVFDRHVPGASMLKGCTDCGVRFKLDKVR